MDVKPAIAVAPTPRKGLICKMSGAVSRHPRAAAAMIIVLTILVIATYVYYHGIWKLGPYGKARKPAKKGKPKQEEGQDEERGDEETEKLIESINQAQ